MRIASIGLRAILIPLLWIAPLCNASAEVRPCTKDGTDVLVPSDFMRPTSAPVLRPDLPHDVDRRELPITVMLRFYVDRSGNVADVCALSRKTVPISPTIKSMRMAAASAVSTWKYPRDFGFTGDLDPRIRYIRGGVSFVFTGKTPVAPREAER